MVSQKILALNTLLFVIKVYNAQAQCQVEYINQPCAMPPLPATPYVQPVTQFVIPVQSDPYMAAIQPSVPDYSKFYNPISPIGGMPAIILDNSNDDDGLDNLLYFLLFALKNKRNGGFGRKGNNGGCCGNSFSGNSCSCGNCNNCSICGRSSGCSNCNGCSNCGMCSNCGSFGNCSGNGCGNCGGTGCGNCSGNGGGKCSVCGKCIGSGNNSGCSNNGSNGSNNMIGCPCGTNCIYIPIPIAVPIGNGFQISNSAGCPIQGIEVVGCDECQSSTVQACNGQTPNEINLIIRTDC